MPPPVNTAVYDILAVHANESAGTMNVPRAHAREKFSNSTNELLENHHERVELETPDAAGGADPALETVEAVERPENGDR